jgi:hypothetical protein
MERAYNLEPNELQQQQQLAEEHQRALAEFGGLTLQLESVRGRIPLIEQRQRELISQVAQRHGVTNFVAARIVNRNLVCQLPDEYAPEAPANLPQPTTVRGLRANGADAPVKE